MVDTCDMDNITFFYARLPYAMDERSADAVVDDLVETADTFCNGAGGGMVRTWSVLAVMDKTFGVFGDPVNETVFSAIFPVKMTETQEKEYGG